MRGISAYVFMGIGVSLNWNWEKKSFDELTAVDKYDPASYEREFEYSARRVTIPIYGTMRLYPAGYGRKNVKPFFDARIGFSLCFDYLVQMDIFREGTYYGGYNTAFYFSPSFGIERRWLGIGKNSWEFSVAYELNRFIKMETPYYYEGTDGFSRKNRILAFRFAFDF